MEAKERVFQDRGVSQLSNTAGMSSKVRSADLPVHWIADIVGLAAFLVEWWKQTPHGRGLGKREWKVTLGDGGAWGGQPAGTGAGLQVRGTDVQILGASLWLSNHGSQTQQRRTVGNLAQGGSQKQRRK